VTFHQDAVRAFDLSSAAERALEVVKFGEAAQDDVDRALPILDIIVRDVREPPRLDACLTNQDLAHAAGR
jgi:hypothetical protein